jgi:hypothetical protein
MYLTGGDGLRNAIYSLRDKDIILVCHGSLLSILKNPETFDRMLYQHLYSKHKYHVHTQ